MAKTTAQIRSEAASRELTGYEVAKLLNEWLLSLGQQPVRPQMIYNYSRNGLIAAGKKGDMSATYTLAEAEAFITKYSAKRTGAKAQPWHSEAQQSGSVLEGEILSVHDEPIAIHPLKVLEA